MIRVTQFWIDTYEEPYLDTVTTTANISGQQVAQTFLNSQDGWLTQVGLYFSRKADAGDVNVVVCETAFGMPNLSRAIARTAIAVADLKVGSISGGAGLPSLVETTGHAPADLSQGGQAIRHRPDHAGDHYVAMTDSDNGVVQGTFFTSTDGAFFSGNLVEDMKMRLYYAKFERTRVSDRTLSRCSLPAASSISTSSTRASRPRRAGPTSRFRSTARGSPSTPPRTGRT